MGENICQKISSFISQNGLIHQTTCSDTPQQNGVAERKNRTLLEMTRALMFESHIPPFFWPEALATANYLTNRLPQQKLKHKTPKDVLQSFFNNPLIHELPPRVFRCTMYVHLPSRSRNKLEPRAIKCVFVGYGTSQKGYRCFDPLHNRMYTTMDCEFFETTFYYNQPRCQGEMSHDHLS